MENVLDRPAKRLKSENGKTNNEYSKSKNNSSSRLKSKTKKIGGGPIIVDTIGKLDESKKKAISIAELKDIKEQHKNLDSSKRFSSIIDIRDESDTSMKNDSSPFKLIRSSQEFSLDNSDLKRKDPKLGTVPASASTTPILFKTRPSSDDGIFWITTPNSLNKQRQTLDNNSDIIHNDIKLPSSPLKIDRDSQSKDLPDTLMDPELKTLLKKYKDSKILEKKPQYNRSISDSKAMTKQKSEVKQNDITQIVATKNSLNDSIIDSLNRKNKIKNINYNIEDDKTDLSNMLMQIGSKLIANSNREIPAIDTDENYQKNEFTNVEQELFHNNESNMNNDKEPNKALDNFDNTSDTFSDDIDMSELVIHATQAPQRNVTNSSDDDCFSEDDDDLMERIELGLTQGQIISKRPNTDQTDITDFADTDTVKVTKDFDLIDLKKVNSTDKVMKYKGMSNLEDENKANKPFQLYDEKDNLAKSALVYDTMKRLQIKNVHEGVFKRDSVVNKQIILKCLTENDELINIMVRDHWASLDFKVNDVIHIILNTPTDNFRLVDKDHNLLIWNPDTLISATRIADAVDCKRKSIINQKFNGPGIVSLPFIVGNIVHSLFQKCLINRSIDITIVDNIIESELNLHSIEIFAANKNRNEIKNIVLEHFEYIKEWITDFLVQNNHQTYSYNNNNSTDFKASNILEIEENIVSPIFGIRGIIDVVIEAQLKDNSKYVVPLEIKTGREYISNRAQVSLYTLLIKQRYEVNCFYTSLVYTKLHQCYLNAIKNNDLKMLINIRNELSQYLVYSITDLPSILQRSSCERCFVLDACMVLNKLTENGTAKDSGIEIEKYEELTSHLDKNLYGDYFQYWDKLITKEEGLLGFMKTDLWRSTAEFRETNGGNCVGNLKIVSCDLNSVPNQFVYMFERDAFKNQPLTSSQLTKNDRIILSDQNSMFGLAYGYIKFIRSDIIVIVTDRNWSGSIVKRPGFNDKNNQIFESVLKTTPLQNSLLSNEITSKIYRIDKDQMFQGMAMARFNLLNLFLPGGDVKSRELIVELRKPELSVTPNFSFDKKTLNLNEDQMKAVETISKIEDYGLILGMPGTGKTTVISTIVDLIVKNGMSVLISSYTHSAVDNICEKLIKNAQKMQENLPLLRVGSPNKISPIVKRYCLYCDEFNYDINDKSDFQDIIDNTSIVAATCLGLNDVVFGYGKRFDYCIIDEASQVTLPIVLGPIALADRFILVGDHYQLPPLVINPEAKQQGLDQSLFKILSDKHPQSIIELTHQYRMCSDIMSLSNELIYDGRLKCGSEEIANQMLKIPYFDTIPIDGTCIKEIMKPERRVVFVNEDAIESLHEISSGDKIENPGEAKMITTLIRVMLMAGIEQESIGVMSFYKAQLRHFFISLQKYKDIEILTADRFQGRDKDVIIISLVRSEVIGDLLKEWRRVNVAMTRAKCKLIIFGSKKLLKNVEQFEGFIDMIESNGWYYDLREGDENVYEKINFLNDERNEEYSNYNSISEGYNNSQTDTQKEGFDTQNSSRKGTARKLDAESKIIKKSKILKYIIDDLNK